MNNKNGQFQGAASNVQWKWASSGRSF